MADTTADLIDGMRDMRIRTALMVTAVRRLGGALTVTRRDAYDSAAFDLQVKQTSEGFEVSAVQREAP